MSKKKSEFNIRDLIMGGICLLIAIIIKILLPQDLKHLSLGLIPLVGFGILLIAVSHLPHKHHHQKS